MATKKKAAPKAAKKSTPVKKAAPAKKAAVKAAPAKASKTAKPAAKAAAPKATASKAAAAKPAPKAPAKKAAAPVKKAAKVAEKVPVSKPVAKPVVKEAVKPEVKKTVPSKEQKPVAKKEETKVMAEVKQPVAAPPPPPPPAPKKVQAPPKPVVIPEIKTKTVKKYEPEFIKSVLDSPETTQSGPTMRYSDAELQEFRELIQKKLDQAKKELAYLQGLITRKDEMGGDETENRYMTMEDGSMSMEREQLAQMASRQINYIDHLEKAMIRIENKTYGICRVTGKLIDKARLRAVPHATLSIEAKQTMNK